MRFISLLVTGVFLLYLTTTVLAASLAEAVTPLEQDAFSVSAEYTSVFHRDLNSASTEIDKYNQGYANLAYGILDNLKLYTKLGSADMNIKGTTSDTKTTEEEYDFGLFWGAGLTATYKFAQDWLVGVDGQYTAWETELKAIKVDGESGTNLKGSLDNREWQVSIFGAKEIGFEVSDLKFLPYIGVKYADFEADYKGLEFTTASATYVGTDKEENDTHFGAVVGINIGINKDLKANIEGQFVDETGVTASLTYNGKF